MYQQIQAMLPLEVVGIVIGGRSLMGVGGSACIAITGFKIIDQKQSRSLTPYIGLK